METNDRIRVYIHHKGRAQFTVKNKKKIEFWKWMADTYPPTKSLITGVSYRVLPPLSI